MGVYKHMKYLIDVSNEKHKESAFTDIVHSFERKYNAHLLGVNGQVEFCFLKKDGSLTLKMNGEPNEDTGERLERLFANFMSDLAKDKPDKFIPIQNVSILRLTGSYWKDTKYNGALWNFIHRVTESNHSLECFCFDTLEPEFASAFACCAARASYNNHRALSVLYKAPHPMRLRFLDLLGEKFLPKKRDVFRVVLDHAEDEKQGHCSFYAPNQWIGVTRPFSRHFEVVLSKNGSHKEFYTKAELLEWHEEFVSPKPSKEEEAVSEEASPSKKNIPMNGGFVERMNFNRMVRQPTQRQKEERGKTASLVPLEVYLDARKSAEDKLALLMESMKVQGKAEAQSEELANLREEKLRLESLMLKVSEELNELRQEHQYLRYRYETAARENKELSQDTGLPVEKTGSDFENLEPYLEDGKWLPAVILGEHVEDGPNKLTVKVEELHSGGVHILEKSFIPAGEYEVLHQSHQAVIRECRGVEKELAIRLSELREKEQQIQDLEEVNGKLYSEAQELDVVNQSLRKKLTSYERQLEQKERMLNNVAESCEVLRENERKHFQQEIRFTRRSNALSVLVVGLLLAVFSLLFMPESKQNQTSVAPVPVVCPTPKIAPQKAKLPTKKKQK